MKTLKLVLKRIWFDMILSGIKKEEYRDISKHNVSLLFDWKSSGLDRQQFIDHLLKHGNDSYLWIYLKDFSENMIFYHAYSKNRDKFIVEWDNIKIGCGNPEYGAILNKKYFILKLGNIIKI